MKRTDVAGYVYDEKSAAVLNTNDGEYEAFKAKRQKFKAEQELRQRVEALERKVAELVAIIERLNG